MKSRGAGRPTEEEIAGPYAYVALMYLAAESSGANVSLAKVINDAIKNGCALDKRKTTAAHEKVVRRLIKKLVKTHSPKRPSAKVLPFKRN